MTEDILPGVVSLTAGVEPDFDDAGCDVAGAANVLTSDAPTLPSRGATMSCSGLSPTYIASCGSRCMSASASVQSLGLGLLIPIWSEMKIAEGSR